MSKPKNEIVPVDFSQDAGSGMENVKSSDLSIPFLMLLQDLSPEVKKTHRDYATRGIEGAQPGHIINSLTREILNPDIKNDRVTFIPCFYQKLFVEWTPREKGGGIVQSHADESILKQTKKNDRGQDILPNGNVIVTTAYFFGLVKDRSGDWQKVVLSMTSTQLKKARKWLSIATSLKFTNPKGEKYTPPLFAHMYHLSSVPESNDQGSWMGWKVDIMDRVNDMALIEESRKVVNLTKESSSRMITAGTPEDEDDAGAGHF